MIDSESHVPIQQFRDNRFELRSVKFESNGLTLEFSERGVDGPVPVTITLMEPGVIGDFGGTSARLTPDVTRKLLEVTDELEKILAAAYAEWETTPKAMQQATAIAAKARAELKEIVTQHAALETDLILKREHLEELKAEADRVARELNQKRDEIAAAGTK